MRQILLVLVLLGSARALAEESPTDLIAQLSDDEYAVREAATEKLMENISTMWNAVEEATHTAGPDELWRLKTIMFEPTRTWLLCLIESEYLELERFERTGSALTNDLQAEIDQYKRVSAIHGARLNADLINDLKEYMTQEKLDGYIAHHTKAVETAESKVTALCEDKKKKEALYRKHRDHLSSRIEQMFDALDKKLSLGECPPKDWSPSLWSIEHRKSLPISFECVDATVRDLLANIAEESDVKFEIAENVNDDMCPLITLRVTVMEVEHAVHWVCRLADITYEYDEENHKFVIKLME
jgi:hypothetical protein